MLCLYCKGLRFDPESGEVCQECGGAGCLICSDADMPQYPCDEEPEPEPAPEPKWQKFSEHDIGGEG